MSSGTFIASRVVAGVVTLLVGMTAIFFMVHLIPGDPVLLFLGDNYDAKAYAAIKAKLGLDQPLWAQYTGYLSGVLSGDWGTSFRTARPVFAEILAQYPYTVALAISGLAIGTLLGVTSGVTSAVHHNSWVDHVSMFVAVIGVCTPNFWLGVLLMLGFSFYLGWLPAIGAGSNDIVDTLKHLFLPALALGTRSAALIARMSRSSMLEVLGQDYVRTAWAKGLPRRAVVYGHAFRNALIPVVTTIGIDLGVMLAGTAVIEIVFARPGVGHLLIDAVLARDYPQIQGTLLFFVAIIVLVNTMVDVVYTFVDPRIELR